MTRDEAIRKVISEHQRFGADPSLAGRDVAIFVELGMLKLDEPKSVDTKIKDLLLYHLGTQKGPVFQAILENAGLKIVEK